MACCDTLHARGPRLVVITSLHYAGADLSGRTRQDIHILGSRRRPGQAPERYLLTVPRRPGYYSGLGDLLAALLLAWTARLGEGELREALYRSVCSVQAVIAATEAAGCKEIRLVQAKAALEDPPRLDFIRVTPL